MSILSAPDRFAGAMIALLLLTACGDGVVSPQHDPLPEIPLPAPVGEANFGSHENPAHPDLLWSPDGSTIYYRSIFGPPFGLRALDLASNETRAVAQEAGTDLGQFRLTADGAYLFFSKESSGTIYRMATAGGSPEVLLQAAGSAFAISPDGRVVAWRSQSTDSIFVRDLSTGATHALSGEGTPFTISPDGTQLVHGRPNRLVVTTLATSETLMFGGDVNAVFRVLDLHWAGSGLELLVSTGGSTIDALALDGSVRPMMNAALPYSATWSPDGRRVAVSSNTICFGSNPCIRTLYLSDVDAASSARIATSRDQFGMPRFSPDGERIAITSGGRLYIVAVPQ